MRFLSLIVLAFLIASANATLTATYSAGGKSVTKQVRMPALRVEAGEAPAPGLAPGPFTVDWKGTLTIPKRYRVYFSYEIEGTAAMKVNGEELPFANGKSERLRLNPGEVTVEIHYKSPDNGAGSFRLYWEERKEFPREPMASTLFTESEPKIDAAHLFASHNCAQCHDPGDLGSQAMPELKYAGPNLTGIGDRTTEAWLTRWIAQPDKLKPTTTMPAMVDHTKPEGAQAAADLGAYLATLKTGTTSPAPDQALAQAGGVHFHNLGCAACHTKPSADEPDYDNKRIPLNNVATKFKDGSLIAFLKNPQQHHEAIKMPNFRLSDEEAKSLAAYLTKESTGNHTPDPSEFPPGDADRGKKLTASLNCAACHEGLEASTTSAPKLADLKDWKSKGCLGPDEKRGKAPRLNLTDEEKAALTPKVVPEIKFDTVASYAARQVESLRCVSCHAHDGKASLLTSVHGETKSLIAHIKGHDEKLDQSRPPLTHMGAMLNTPFLESMLNGTANPRPRPWLDMRMPAFPLHAKHLADGLARQHGLGKAEPGEEKPAPDLVKAGEQLASMTGYACVTCHAQNDKPALAAFEVKGINLGQVHKRLRPDYYHQWMFNPARLVPDTKMPRYTNPDDGTGLRPDLLEGDAKKQFDAIRAYLQSLQKK